MKYTAIIPFIPDMGTVGNIDGVYDKSTETKEEEALWHINKMREHDGLRPLKNLPLDTVFVRYKERSQ